MVVDLILGSGGIIPWVVYSVDDFIGSEFVLTDGVLISERIVEVFMFVFGRRGMWDVRMNAFVAAVVVQFG